MQDQTNINATSKRHWAWISALLLALILAGGLYVRLNGIAWDEGHYLHPDERFLMFVESSIAPVHSISEYFNTDLSTLNPHNTGQTFFVYGTWPIFAVRYLLDAFQIAGSDVYKLGRPLSALINLATVFLVYLIGTRAYSKRVGLLAAAFASFSVLSIQLSHFFKEDTFMTFFTTLALYLAVCIATLGRRGQDKGEAGLMADSAVQVNEDSLEGDGEQQPGNSSNSRFLLNSHLLLYIAFGLAVGMAMASKINAAPVAFALPLAEFIRLSRLPRGSRGLAALESLAFMTLAGLVSFLTFRVLQPYAFSGPGFLGLLPNPKWLDNLRELQGITSPDSIFGFPPSLQWADRPIWFALENIIRWGLGIPLGVLSFSGFLWAGWRMIRGEWRNHAVLWFWTAGYFLWQSSVFNPTMRYLLPVYPTLAIFAAWAVFAIWDVRSSRTDGKWLARNWPKALAAVVGALVLAATMVWAVAFAGIYERPVTRIAASRWIFDNIPGPINLAINTGDEIRNQPVPFPYGYQLLPGEPYISTIMPVAGGSLDGIFLARLVDYQATGGTERLRATLAPADNTSQMLATAEAMFDLPPDLEGKGQPLTLQFAQPVNLEPEKYYQLTLLLDSENTASLGITGTGLANESSWDDVLPLRVDGYDGYGGIYQDGLNLEMYWEDNPEKIDRFVSTLNQAEYVMISSSRQWGSVGRLPDRFPLSTAYYRYLVGCPDTLDIEPCYNIAELGTYQGTLGFDLLKVFEADPTLGPFKFNDQPSEEAFTVYDHPKVFIFKKNADYDQAVVRQKLEDAYYSAVRARDQAAAVSDKDLLLPEDRLQVQLTGGTWSDLFNPAALINRYPWLGAVVWYLAVALLGLLGYPLLRLILPGLADRGYPAARAAGLLGVSYLVWLAGSFEIPFTRLTITAAIIVLAIAGILAAYFRRSAIREEWRTSSRYFITVEGLFLGIFIIGLLIRFGNPDLWHPWKGGEKPMDFSYFNAVLKSTTFPPYDPWFSGGYINYYYYGFVFVGVLVKWLGIEPSIAYNLIIPTLFAMIALGAFSLGWNLFTAVRRSARVEKEDKPDPPDGGMFDTQPALDEQVTTDPSVELDPQVDRRGSWIAGVSAMLGMAILGNLGIIAMVVRGYQRLGASGVGLDQAGLLTKIVWTGEGFIRAITGSGLPYAIADWYWLPSRAIPAPNDVEPITEFPMFTVLYADLHAHLIVLPIALLALAWAFSVILARGRWEGWLAGIGGFIFGGLAIGALRPTNTWDFYPYLAIGAAALGYAMIRYYRKPSWSWIPDSLPSWLAGLVAAICSSGILVLLAYIMFEPYARWYGQGYNAVDLWRGTHTTITAYLVHWGLFLFLIISWLVWETHQWMANTPLVSIRRLAPFRGLIILLIILVAVWIGVLIYFKVNISWFVVPLAVWSGILIFKPGMHDAKRAVLFLTGSGLLLTLMVEVVVLRGDIGRMNTVFKFYLQVWTFFSISAAAALSWLFLEIPGWTPNWRKGWGLSLALLVGAAALYPILAGVAKVRDRMTETAPHSLNGMEFMKYSKYVDLDTEMDLSQDYDAIRWLQENVEGSPVIVEGNMVEYHWGSRYTIYTGLPGVLGWNWHQRQQRAVLTDGVVENRLTDINGFFLTTDEGAAREFLEKYDISYVIVGQLERALYDESGIAKFEEFDGQLWIEVYRNPGTVIYRVNHPASSAS